MNDIQTTHGLIDLMNIDFICPHEHLLIDMTHEAIMPKSDDEQMLFNGPVTMNVLGLLRLNPYIIKTNLVLDSLELAVSEMHELKAIGCELLVDVTSIGLGRDARKIKMIAERAGIPVAVGCGFFTHDAVAKEYQDWDSEKIGSYIIDEIFFGIDDTGIMPGVIGEIGISKQIAPFEKRSLEGAAIAQRKSGLPIYLHTYPWSHSGLEAINLLINEGVPPERICVCHMDVTFDVDYLYKILSTRAYVEFDNFGKEFYFLAKDEAFAGGPFETDRCRIAMLARLLREGYGRQLLLANDVCLKSMLCAYGGLGYGHVHKNMIAMLIAEGATESDINLLITRNPQEFLVKK